MAADARRAGIDVACAVNAAWNALTYVYDPGLLLDVVSLGFVYDVRGEDGVIVVEMTLASPGCPGREMLPEMVRAAVAGAVGGARAMELRVVRDPPWSPAMIDRLAEASTGLPPGCPAAAGHRRPPAGCPGRGYRPRGERARCDGRGPAA